MLPFPTLDRIWEEFGKERVDANIYAKAKRDYETKLKTELHLLEQFKARPGLTEAEAIKLFCEFLIREAVYLAQHDSN
jgi:histone H3/H4